MDLTNITSISLEGADAELRPVYDRVWRTFSVQLWVGGELCGVHGMTDNFRYPEQPLEAIDAFLAEHDVRRVSEEESVLLYAGLVHAKGGADWQALVMAIAAAEQA